MVLKNQTKGLHKKNWRKVDLTGEYNDRKHHSDVEYAFNCTMIRYEGDFLLKVVLKIKNPGQYLVNYVRDGKLKLKVEKRDVVATVGYGDIVEGLLVTTHPDEDIFLAMYHLDGAAVRANFKRTSAFAMPIFIKCYVPSRL